MKKQISLFLAILMLMCSVPITVSAKDMTYQIVIEPQYEEVGRFHNGYAAVKVDGKWGYINEAGEIVVEPKYDWAGICGEGVAITLIEGECLTHWGVLPCMYAYLVHMDGAEYTLYEDPDRSMHFKIGKLPYDYHWNYTSACNIDVFMKNTNRWISNEGIVCVAQIPFTQSGDLIKPDLSPLKTDGFNRWLMYEQTGPSIDGVIPATVIVEAGGSIGSILYGTDGQIIEYFPDYSSVSAPCDSLLMACAKIEPEPDSWYPTYRWGLLDENRNWLAEPQFTDYMCTLDGVLFHDDLMPVRAESGKWGAINTSGKLVLDAVYDSMTCFNHGFSRVMQDGKCFFIDTNGEPYIILGPDGKEANITLSSKVSSEGLAAVYDATIEKAYYVNVFAAHNGVVPAVSGSDGLGLESYVESFDDEGMPESMAIPTRLVPVNEGELWGFAELTFATSENPFTDVPEGKFYYEPVLWAVEQGITSGTTETTFSPNDTCTRGQVVTFLWRAAGKPEPKSASHPFTDVSEGAYYYKAMLWAVENNITSGITKTTFAPNEPCTRGQVVTFLWRAKDKPAPASTSHPFTDVAEGKYYYTAMLWAVENNITSGTGKATFAPNDPCTRGQVVTFLYRAYQNG